MSSLQNKMTSLKNKFYSHLNWYLKDKKKYFQSEFLNFPKENHYPAADFHRLMSFYTKGYYDLDQIEVTSILGKIKDMFKEIQQEYESQPIKKEYCYTLDSQKKLWVYNNAEGLIQLLIENHDHPLHSEHATGYDTAKYNLKDFFSDFPVIRELLTSSTHKNILAETIKNPSDYPVMIKVERKTHSPVDNSYNENYIHIDTLKGNYKVYFYLSDVDSESGPIKISEGSHHWKKYPKLLRKLMVSKSKHIQNSEYQRLKIEPLKEITGSAGKVFGFTGSTVHCATNLKAGETRWTIQVYYYHDNIWSTSLKH